MSAKDQIKQLVDYFKREPYLKDKTDAMGDGLMLGASLADEANERSKAAEDTTKRTEEKYKEQILAQDLNQNKDPELVDLRNGNATAGERIAKFEQETTAQFQHIDPVVSYTSKRLNGAISVSEFGAIGNANFFNPINKKWYEDEAYLIPAKDDTFAIQATIDSALDNSEIMLSGNHLVHNLVMSGKKGVAIRAKRGQQLIRDNDKEELKTLFTLHNSKDIVIDRIDFRNENYLGYYVEEENIGTKHLLRIAGGSDGVLIKNCKFNGSVRDGIGIFTYAEYEGLIDYYDNGIPRNIRIINNDFDNNDRCGIQVTMAENVEIRMNNIRNSYQSFVNCEGFQYALPRNENDETLVDMFGLKNITVDNNILTNEKDFKTKGMTRFPANQFVNHTSGNRKNLKEFYGFTFTNNQIFGAEIALRIEESVDLTIFNNTFKKCHQGIYAVYVFDAIVEGNSYLGCPLNSELPSNNQIDFTGTATQTAFYVFGDCEITIINNKIKGSAKVGIGVRLFDKTVTGGKSLIIIKGNTVIEPNIVADGNSSGIFLQSGTVDNVTSIENIQVEDNAIILNKGGIKTNRGVMLSGSGVPSAGDNIVVKGNTITGAPLSNYYYLLPVYVKSISNYPVQT